MSKCVAAEEGILHTGHYYWPHEDSDAIACGGVPWTTPNNERGMENRFKSEYYIALWVMVDGVDVLNKSYGTPDLNEAKDRLKELAEHFPQSKFFIVMDETFTKTSKVSND